MQMLMNNYYLKQNLYIILFKSLSEENFRRKKGGWGVFSEIHLRKKIVLGLS